MTRRSDANWRDSSVDWLRRKERAAIGAKLGVHSHDCEKPWDWRARNRGDR
jgi:hypothetical protein